ncbi:hypothetical protein [Actinoplanes sp. NPDC049599]|uniref:hypothetical protein n=1 Tax=Actinoplanes sp. NPDC049599 TaxID=3363903 RepID=UPI003796EB72
MTVVRLITVGLAEYPGQPTWTVPAAADSRRKVESLLGAHGAVTEDWTDRATSDKISKELKEWAKRGQESHIVYWTGHGEFTDDGYFLALADTEELVGNDSLSDGQISAALLRLERARTAAASTDWVLLILDTCGSRGGGWRIWTSFGYPPRNVGVIATTDDGAAYSGAFPDVFEEVLASFNGNDTDAIPVHELVRRLTIPLGVDKINEKFELSAVLPHRSDVLPPVRAAMDVYGEMRAVLANAPAEIRDHFYAKAQGCEIGEAAWNFAGRVVERRRIAEWLRTADGGMLVVTGPAGCGKSALLGMVLASSDPKVRSALHAAGHAPIPEDLRSGDLAFDAILHLSGRTIAETASSVAAQLGLGAVAGHAELLDYARQRQQSRTLVVVDALDEARDPFTIAALLRGLAALPGFGVLLGTRRALGEDLDNNQHMGSEILDHLVLQPNCVLTLGRDPGAVRSYVENRLRFAGLQRTGTYVRNLAERIAVQNQPFLFARLAVHEILADPAIGESDALLDRLLGDGHGRIFAHAVRRLSACAPDVEALMHVLAYARGSGFPRTFGVWAAAAASIGTAPVDDAGVGRALRLAAPYIMQDSENGQAVYRLAHRTFAEWYHRRDTS